MPVPGRMKRWTVTGPRRVELRETPAPEPAADEVVVRIELTAVSAGSELHAYRSGPGAFMDEPGYLAVGRVVAAGREVTEPAAGARVFVPAPHGDLAVVPWHRAVPIPDAVAAEDAVLCYLGSLGLYCLHAGEYRAGENVAVVGLGVVGLCTSLVAAMCGARLHAVDADEDRLAFAAGLSLPVSDARRPDVADDVQRHAPEGIDLVIDTSGAWEGLDTAVRLCRRGSRIAVLGVYRQLPRPETGAALHQRMLSFPAKFHYDGIRVIGCANHPWSDGEPGSGWSVQRSLRHLFGCVEDGRLRLSSLVTDRIAPDGLPEVYRRLDAGDRSVLGVVIDWS